MVHGFMVQEKVLRKMVQGSKANVHALGLNSSPLKKVYILEKI
jgi:hypothetical protein